MFPPFSQEIARRYCMEFISMLESGQIIIKQLTPESLERQGHGFMIGSLVCNRSSDSKRIVLHAVSGISIQAEFSDGSNALIHNGIEHIIVPPVVSSLEINNALQKNDLQIHLLTNKINASKNCEEVETLKANRKKLTDESLRNVFSLYEFNTADGNTVLLEDIIKNQQAKKEYAGKLPRTGTGDCCAPKLLSYAFKNVFVPVSLDEVYYGRDTATKHNGISYEPCDERCGYILPSILGLEILYRDSQIVVVNKPSGLLSVPGRGEDKQDCVCSRLRRLFPECIEQPSVHRLDMETSGLLVLALTKEAHKKLNLQFAEGIVSKKYTALLDGSLYKAKGLLAPHNNEKNGIMQLKFRLDVENRPHQIYDEVYGKNGITEWQLCGIEKFTNPVTGIKKDATRITFIPHTGRTHQLRLASSDMHGFGLPIIGDTLYGNCEPGERLMLHSCELCFYHPVSGKQMHFFCPADF